jgi:hypothetical protein
MFVTLFPIAPVGYFRKSHAGIMSPVVVAYNEVSPVSIALLLLW